MAILDGVFHREIDVIKSPPAAPRESLLEPRQKAAVLHLLQEIEFVLLFLHSHFIEDGVMLVDSERPKIAHHHEIFADISALEFPGEKIGHEPADEIATACDCLADYIVFHLEPPRNRQAVMLEDSEDMTAVSPLILLHFLDAHLCHGRPAGDGRDRL